MLPSFPFMPRYLGVRRLLKSDIFLTSVRQKLNRTAWGSCHYSDTRESNWNRNNNNNKICGHWGCLADRQTSSSSFLSFFFLSLSSSLTCAIISCIPIQGLHPPGRPADVVDRDPRAVNLRETSRVCRLSDYIVWRRVLPSTGGGTNHKQAFSTQRAIGWLTTMTAAKRRITDLIGWRPF